MTSKMQKEMERKTSFTIEKMLCIFLFIRIHSSEQNLTFGSSFNCCIDLFFVVAC